MSASVVFQFDAALGHARLSIATAQPSEVRMLVTAVQVYRPLAGSGWSCKNGPSRWLLVAWLRPARASHPLVPGAEIGSLSAVWIAAERIYAGYCPIDGALSDLLYDRSKRPTQCDDAGAQAIGDALIIGLAGPFVGQLFNIEDRPEAKADTMKTRNAATAWQRLEGASDPGGNRRCTRAQHELADAGQKPLQVSIR